MNYSVIVDILVPALLQGVTEFLPISSSSILLTYSFLSMSDYSLVDLDIVLHFGTLIAVLIVMRTRILSLIYGVLNKEKQSLSIFYFLCTASIPIIVIGFFIYILGILDIFRNITVIAFATIFFGILLIFADRKKETINRSPSNIRDILMVGFAQALSVIPGVSRSGIVITALRSQGISRTKTIDLSLLLSIPAIGGSMILSLLANPILVFSMQFIIGMIVACIVALCSISFLRVLVSHIGFTPFGYFRIALGIILLFYIYI